MDERLLRYQKLSENDRESFRIALNHLLLTESFLIRSWSPTAGRTASPRPTPRLSTPTLELAGWSLRKDEHLGVISFQGPASARLQFKKDESIFLLVLRLLYEEKAGELVIHGERTVRQEEVQDRLRTIADLSYKKTPFVSLLRRFQALRLIQVVGSEEDPEATVILFPSIPFVLDGVSLDDIAERIDSYNRGRDEPDEPEEDDES